MPVDVVLPKVDMDMESGVIAEWKVAEGASVRQGDILFDMETSKSIMEVEAPASGIVRGLAPVDGASLPVGTVVARIDTEGDDERPAPPSPALHAELPREPRPTAPVERAQARIAAPPGEVP